MKTSNSSYSNFSASKGTIVNSIRRAAVTSKRVSIEWVEVILNMGFYKLDDNQFKQFFPL